MKQKTNSESDLSPTYLATSALDEPAAKPSAAVGASFGASELRDLKRRTAHGALVSTFGQGANFFLRIGSMVVLARLLTPKDFGLVGMATACTGFLELFRDAGLSMAAVQRASITRAQTSTLFWINLAVGGILAALCVSLAPILANFYHDQRLIWITAVLGSSFIFNGAAAQHRAILQRNMRFPALIMIDVVSLILSIALGIGMAVAGKGYWALVATAVCPAFVSLIGVWIADWWVPGLPQRKAGVLSMLKYGGAVTLNTVIVYFAYNADKVLIGRFWGADALGIYGRAYQLINLPTANLSACIAQVAFPALSRLQHDPERLKSYFLKGYGLFLSMAAPITMACALFSEDIVLVFLGAKWGAAAPVFRMLAPGMLVLALINPFGWFLLATGQAARSLKIAFLIAPVLILGYLVGLGFGSTGVAGGFSVATVLLIVPVILWATHGTAITARETIRVALPPFLSILAAAAVALGAWSFIHLLAPGLLRLTVSNLVFFGVYALMLLLVMGQKSIYVNLLREVGVWPFRRSAP